jgi:alkylation response protein AidB-like acyl-CoA dehydrogenase
MSLLPNAEQLMLRDAAQSFLAERSPVALQRQLRDTGQPQRFDSALWQQVAELGWPAAPWPAEVGGLAAGWKALAGVFEACGRHLAATPLLSSAVLCATLLVEVGSDTVRDTWLPSLLDGSKRLALALDEQARHAPQRIQTIAQNHEGGWRLQGHKADVMDGVGADAYIVVARAEGKPALFLLPADTPGLTVQPLNRIDSRNAARLHFSGVLLPQGARLGAADTAAPALELALDRARLCLAAETLGLSRAVLAMTLDYLKQRVQFDVPIGSFQALQHRAARLFVALELLDSSVAAGFEALDNDAAKVPALASLAKARAADVGELLLNEALQLHGGIGVTDEFDLGLFFKRARVLGQSLGDALFHRDRYARLHGF